jgi:predicted ester cyclase
MVNETQNVQLIRRYFEEISRGNLAILDELCAPDIIHHTTHSPKPIVGLKNVKKLATSYHSAFPDLQYHLAQVISEGELVAINWKATGTFKGIFSGILPTGKSCLMSGMSINRIVEGKIVERWIVNDDLGILQQIGLPRWLLGIAVTLSVIFPFGSYKLKQLFKQDKAVDQNN